MFGQVPIDLSQVKEENIDKEILRTAIIAELDAINVYEQMAARSKNTDLKIVLMDIANEEKTHMGEFLELLLRLDPQQVKELAEGKGEIEELLGK
ncbi:ferritin family protein [Candidatus Borrarchaeum sp.]|uniref:ferritin family protein n=1 Tax=Candidatus Borrarchaeum sp. TaxID=2846742 RepID=UPI00257F1DD7|nr:ferritin family protein [Candidatus Borrarchaeum sp.]